MGKGLQRKPQPERSTNVKKRERTLKDNVAIYLIGTVLCLYLGILCGAAWVPGNSFAEFSDHFQKFILGGGNLLQMHLIVGFTAATQAFLLCFWVAFSLGFLLVITKISHPYAGQEYGVAKWGNAKEFSEQFADHDASHIVEINPGDVKLEHPLTVNTHNYWLAEGVELSIDNKKTSNLNMLVIGPPGSGKSFRLARPILSHLCGNFLVTDPKGELYRQTGQFFEDNGYEVMVMNVESEEAMPMSIRFNPFRYINNESDIMSIANILMKSTTDPEAQSGGNDAFFEQSAESLLTSLLYLIHYYYPEEQQNWKTFVRLLDSTAVKATPQGRIDNSSGDCILSIAKTANDWWKKQPTHPDNLGDTFPGYVAIEKFYNGAVETTSSIVASLDAHCRYMKLGCVVNLLSEDEINITDTFGYCRKTEASPTGKRILFIVTSEDKRYYDWIPSMIYSLYFDALYHLTASDPALHDTLPEHLTFLMDEFANVTLPNSFVEKLSTMRSRNMSAIIIIQNLIQLKRKFPQYDMDKDLIANCSIIDILGAPDMDSCEYLSKHFGKQTIHKASQSNSRDIKGSSSESEDVMEHTLLSPDDIFAMKKDGECAIVVKGTDPLWEPKCQMQNSEFVKLLCRKEPYDPLKRRHTEEGACADAIAETFADSVIVSGNAADHLAEILFGNHGNIVTLSEEDISGETEPYYPPGAFSSPEERAIMKAKFEKYAEENRPVVIDLNSYHDPDPDADAQYFMNRCECSMQLDALGYRPQQILALYPLIMKNFSSERISGMFRRNLTVAEIKKSVEIFTGEKEGEDAYAEV